MNNKLEHIEKIRDKNSIKILIILITSAIIIRLYFTPFNIPISLDGIDYFAYAVAMSRDGVHFQMGILQQILDGHHLFPYFFQSCRIKK